MSKAPKPIFRFVTTLGQPLTERIIEIEALAAKRGMPAQPRQGLSPELEARMRELMAEKSCSRGWARHLARREFELAAATAALLKSDAS